MCVCRWVGGGWVCTCMYYMYRYASSTSWSWLMHPAPLLHKVVNPATCAGGFSCHELALFHKLHSWWSSPATCAGGRCFSVINLHCVMVAVCMCVCVCVCLCVCIHVPDPLAKPSIKDYVLVKQRLRPSVLDTRVY